MLKGKYEESLVLAENIINEFLINSRPLPLKRRYLIDYILENFKLPFDLAKNSRKFEEILEKLYIKYHSLVIKDYILAPIYKLYKKPLSVYYRGGDGFLYFMHKVGDKVVEPNINLSLLEVKIRQYTYVVFIDKKENIGIVGSDDLKKIKRILSIFYRKMKKIAEESGINIGDVSVKVLKHSLDYKSKKN